MRCCCCTAHKATKHEAFLIGGGCGRSYSAALAADVGVSVQVGELGFYGRIDIGNLPQPRLIYARRS
jgi:hypothetical protein